MQRRTLTTQRLPMPETTHRKRQMACHSQFGKEGKCSIISCSLCLAGNFLNPHEAVCDWPSFLTTNESESCAKLQISHRQWLSSSTHPPMPNNQLVITPSSLILRSPPAAAPDHIVHFRQYPKAVLHCWTTPRAIRSGKRLAAHAVYVSAEEGNAQRALRLARERSRREVEQVGRCSEAKAHAVPARGRLKKKPFGQLLY